MPNAPKTPQQKKRLSLLKDRRNTYGENAKSSRKNIPKSKSLSHRKVRNAARQQLDKLDPVRELEAETIGSTLVTPRLQKGRWQKSPDTPLGHVVADKLRTRVATRGAKKKRRTARLAVVT
jgi:hypothetical protein